MAARRFAGGIGAGRGHADGGSGIRHHRSTDLGSGEIAGTESEKRRLPESTGGSLSAEGTGDGGFRLSGSRGADREPGAGAGRWELRSAAHARSGGDGASSFPGGRGFGGDADRL